MILEQFDRLVMPGQRRTPLGEEHRGGHRLDRILVEIVVVHRTAKDLRGLGARRHPVGVGQIDHRQPPRFRRLDRRRGGIEPRVFGFDQIFHPRIVQRDGAVVGDARDDGRLAVQPYHSQFHKQSSSGGRRARAVVVRWFRWRPRRSCPSRSDIRASPLRAGRPDADSRGGSGDRRASPPARGFPPASSRT